MQPCDRVPGSDRTKDTIDKKTLSFARLCGNPEEGVQGGQFVRGVRSIGSAALSCCAVAEGALDLWQVSLSVDTTQLRLCI